MSYELDFDDIEYDRGYGPEYGTLVVEVTPVFTDETFDAHNGAGVLQRYGDSNALTDFEIEGATLFLVDQDGGEYAEIDDLSNDEILAHVSHDSILEALIRAHY